MNEISHVTTHVLDAAAGIPACGVPVELAARHGPDWVELASGETDPDGRIKQLGPSRLDPGIHRLVFHTGAYFAARGTQTFYPDVSITFEITEGDQHYHVPLLLSPFAYSTYKGS